MASIALELADECAELAQVPEETPNERSTP
jgi:hypothetical protein